MFTNSLLYRVIYVAYDCLFERIEYTYLKNRIPAIIPEAHN